MSLEDEIRRIVREEIARKFPEHRDGTAVPTHPPFDWQKALDTPNACRCIHGDLRTRSCGHEQCSIRPPFVAYKANVTTGHAPAPYERPQPPSYLMGDDLNHRTGERAHHMAAWKDAMKKAYDGAAQQRMGCTCPPGSQTSCPDVTCPWKPR